MLKNKILLSTLYLIVFAFAIVAGGWQLPAYQSRLPLLMLLALSDLYLISRISGFFIKNIAFKRLMKVLVVVPSLLIITFFSSMAFITPLDWNPHLRTIWLGTAMILYMMRVMPLIVFLIMDVHKLTFKKMLSQKNETFYRILMKASVWLSVVIGAVLIMGATCWVYDFKVEKVDVTLKRLPPAFNNYQIVQVSDLHLGRNPSIKYLSQAISTINALRPDMVVFTGDLVNYSTSEAYPYVGILSRLSAPDGVYAVLGNHDYGDYLRWTDAACKENNIQELETLLAQCKWNLLRNSSQKLCRDSSFIFVAGIDHWSPHKRFPVRYDFDGAMLGIDPEDVTILLAHDPVFWQKKVMNSSYDVDLTLSGHTHAFQMGLNIGSKHFSPPALLKKYWKGLYGHRSPSGKSVQLYVNAGLGHIMYPGRIGMNPEITLIRLIQGEPN